MNQFDLLKSHIDAFTRKDGSVVAAHDDKRQAAQPKYINETHKWASQNIEAEKTKRGGKVDDGYDPVKSKYHADKANWHMKQEKLGEGSDHIHAASAHLKASKLYGSRDNSEVGNKQFGDAADHQSKLVNTFDY